MPFNVEAATVQQPEGAEAVTEQDLRQWVGQSLLQEDEQREANGARRFKFQPLILNYAQQRAGDLTKAHQRAIEYYWANRKQETEWQGEDDLTEYFEAFHHHCELNQYAQANDILDCCREYLGLQGYNLRQVSLYQRLTQEWQPISQKDQTDWGWAWISLGNAYENLSDYPQAIACHQKTQAIFEQLRNRKGKANSLMGLGNAYNSLGHYQQAIEFYQQSLEIARVIGDRYGQANSLIGLGNAYDSLGQYPQAIEFYQQSIEITRDIGDRKSEANSLLNLATVYYRCGRIRKGLTASRHANGILKELGLPQKGPQRLRALV